MSQRVSYTSYDFVPHNIVPVIASFDTEKHIKPLYVRINGQSYKIQSAYQKLSSSIVTEFHCQIIDGDYLKPFTLTYYSREVVWTIPDYRDCD